MTTDTIRIAVDLYDRHIPLFQGRLQPDNGPTIEFLEVGMVPPRRHGADRHRRMLVDREFDGAEVSLASYLTARQQGMRDLIALPIFPRRLFSHNHIFVGDRAGIRKPSDLAGRKVAIWAFQVTMSVLAKGDLKRDHGVDWRDIHWVAQHREEIPKSYDGDLMLSLADPGFDPHVALLDGLVDAYINPHPPERIMVPGSGVSRLFPDGEGASRDYVAKHGYFPIMHVLALKASVLDAHPGLASDLMHLFGAAKETARQYYVDPNFSTVMHARNLLEREEQTLGPSLWNFGLDETNRRNLEDFIGFCLDQRILDYPINVDDVFALN
ncbi:MAG: taurine ABC transporter substrate-binding protein [Alphaproteobacteria bacterium]